VEGVDPDAIGGPAIGGGHVEERAVLWVDLEADTRGPLGHCRPARLETVDEELDPACHVDADVVDLSEDERPTATFIHLPGETDHRLSAYPSSPPGRADRKRDIKAKEVNLEHILQIQVTSLTTV